MTSNFLTGTVGFPKGNKVGTMSGGVYAMIPTIAADAQFSRHRKVPLEHLRDIQQALPFLHRVNASVQTRDNHLKAQGGRKKKPKHSLRSRKTKKQYFTKSKTLIVFLIEILETSCSG